MAERFHPELFGQKAQVTVSLGELHLAALRDRARKLEEERTGLLHGASVTPETRASEVAPPALSADERSVQAGAEGSRTDEES